MLSLIIPVYRNEDNLPRLLDAVSSLSADIDGCFEAVFVVDGSPDRCYERLRTALATQPFGSQLILLSRNFGSFAAIRAGLEHGQGTHFAVMAADLQEPPELILRMSRLLTADEADVVVAVRDSRADPLISRLMSGLFWRAYRKFVVPDLPPGGVDIFACNERFRDQLLQMREQHGSLVAQIFWMGYRRATVNYSRQLRTEGRSAWTFRKKLTYFVDSIFSVTDLPIRMLTYVGGTTAVLAAGLAGVIAICRMLGVITVPGYTAIMMAVIFFGALNLFGLGLVGSFAWRAYENSKGRPLHLELRCHEYAPATAQVEPAANIRTVRC